MRVPLLVAALVLGGCLGARVPALAPGAQVTGWVDFFVPAREVVQRSGSEFVLGGLTGAAAEIPPRASTIGVGWRMEPGAVAYDAAYAPFPRTS